MFGVSLPDAKVRKYVIQRFLRSDLSACDFGEDVESLAEVLGKKVGWESGTGRKAGYDTLDAGVGTKQGIVVAGIGDDDLVV